MLYFFCKEKYVVNKSYNYLKYSIISCGTTKRALKKIKLRQPIVKNSGLMPRFYVSKKIWR